MDLGPSGTKEPADVHDRHFVDVRWAWQTVCVFTLCEDDEASPRIVHTLVYFDDSMGIGWFVYFTRPESQSVSMQTLFYFDDGMGIG